MESKNKGKKVIEEEPSDDPTIMELCKEAWRISSKLGNHNLALKILEEASLLYNNSALIHRVRGEIFSQVHDAIHDNHYFTKAKESAKEAARLSPHSISYSLFYLSFTIQNVNELLEEGNRGLAIQKPIDPATEDFTDLERDFKTSGERIGAMRMNIRDIVKECQNLVDSTSIPDLEEFKQRVSENTNMLVKKADPRKVAVKQIIDYPKWRIPQMVSELTNKEVLVSDVFVREACKEAVRISQLTEDFSLPLAIIEKVRLHNKNSALFYRAQGEIFYLMFSRQDRKAENYTDEYLFKARESEKEAVRLAPNSIEFAMNFVKLLFLCFCYEEAIEEGEKALAIENPDDPAEHYLVDLAIDLPDRGERTDYMRELISNFVEICKCNVTVSESGDNSADVMSQSQKALLAKYDKTKEEAHPRMAPVEWLEDYPNQYLGEEERRQKIAALFAIGKIIESFQEGSTKEPVSEKLMGYWNSLSVDDKRKLLNLNTDELFAHFSSKSTKKILSEAFNFYEANKSWTFRGCFCCDKRYANDEDHLAHTIKEHVGTLSPQQDSYLPRELSGGWDSVVKKYLWPGYDASAALRILEDILELLTYFEEDFKVDVDRMQSAIGYLLTENCPKSNNAHTFALENVQTVLKYLLENDFLAAEHLKMVTDYSMDRLEVLVPDSRPWELGLHQTHLCICLLGLSELIEILKFLEEITKISNATETSKIPKAEAPPTDIKEEIDLDEKSLCLLLNEQFISSSDDSVTTNEDAVFKSIFQGSSSEEGLEKWVQLENKRKQQGKELQQLLKKNVNSIKKWCDQKSELLRSEKTTENLAALLNDEFMARKNNSGHVPQSYEAILQEQQEETERAIPGKDRRSRLDILKQALSVDYKHEEILAVVRTKISDMDMYEDGALEKPTPFQQVDNRIKEAMRKIAKSIGLKIVRVDAKIMRAYKESEKLAPELNNFSGADYRTIVLPLVKSCILAKLDKQVNTAVEEKSDVASDENQAHVSPEKKKSVNEKGNKSKKKKKSAQKKQNKKGKDARQLQSSTDKKDDIVSTDDVDLEKEEERRRREAEEDGRMLEENMRLKEKILEDQKKAYFAQKEREAAQQEGTAGLTDVTDQGVYIGSLYVRVGATTTATNTASVKPEVEGAQQEDTTGLTAATTESTDAAATGGGSTS